MKDNKQILFQAFIPTILTIVLVVWQINDGVIYQICDGCSNPAANLIVDDRGHEYYLLPSWMKTGMPIILLLTLYPLAFYALYKSKMLSLKQPLNTHLKQALFQDKPKYTLHIIITIITALLIMASLFMWFNYLASNPQ